MSMVLSKSVKVNKAKTGHGNDCGRIQIQAIDLAEFIGEEVFIVVERRDRLE
ncbi:MAG: hypothetical protein ACLFTR_03375 [Candidatus Woesearchaeota archaeon]